MVPTVTGAPGDGKTSLTKAIKKQLFARGIRLVNKKAPNVYTVRGKVKMSKPEQGKQNIEIKWQVFNPKGKSLGTVSQNNTIPKGSLDGPWGQIADSAAGAAAKGIAKLMPTPARKS